MLLYLNLLACFSGLYSSFLLLETILKIYRARIETTSCSISERQQQWSQTTHETAPYSYDHYGLVLANGVSLPQPQHYLYNFNNPFLKSAFQESDFFKVPDCFASIILNLKLSSMKCIVFLPSLQPP